MLIKSSMFSDCVDGGMIVVNNANSKFPCVSAGCLDISFYSEWYLKVSVYPVLLENYA